MAIPAAGKPTPLSTAVPEALLANSQRAVAATVAQVLEANQRLFNEERDKLERWADDKLLAAEEALKNTKARIAQLKRDARKAATDRKSVVEGKSGAVRGELGGSRTITK